MTLEKLLSVGKSFELSKQQAEEIERAVSVNTSVSMIQRRPTRKQMDIPRKGVQCYRCGGEFPHQNSCPAKGKTCHKCGKIGHFAKLCKSAKPPHKPNEVRPQQRRGGYKPQFQQQGKVVRQVDHTQPTGEEDHYIWSVYQNEMEVNNVNKPLVTVTIDNSPVKILVDTGSSINLLDDETFRSLVKCLTLTKEHNPVIPYAGRPMNIRGKFSTEISGNNATVSSTVYVTSEGKGNLLSYETAVLLGYVPEICEVNEVGESIPEKTTDRYSKLCEEYSDIFEGIGKLKGVQVKLHIDETIQPVQNRHRRIPYHIREKVQEELEKLEQLDIIEEVVDVPTPWVSPIVAQPKPKKPNELRICVDMREANRAIRRERHVTPTVDDVIFELNGSSYFTKLDLNKGYHQLELAPESRYITTFSANQKLWRYKRLMFGLSSAAEVLQNAIQTTLQGIPKAFNISDDILVHGRTQAEHDDNLRQVFEQVRATNLTLNREKCVFNQRHLSFFGHVWSPEGVSADPQKLEAIRKMKTPENAEEVRSLLGMAGYVSRSVPNFATITEPLRKLTRSKVTWEWGEDQGESLKKLHDLLQSQRVMA